MTEEAAQNNFCILKKYKFDLNRALQAQEGSPLSYGSEFRDPSLLKLVFEKHPNWTRMYNILKNGSDWPLQDMDNETRASDLIEALEFQNHKGATENQDLLLNLCSKDVKFGYGLVLPLSKVTRIPGILMAPMNIMRQNTIDEQGRIVEKDRLTHDQSYVWRSGHSVNSRVEKDALLPCMFGHCIKRIINWAVAARRK